MILLDTNVVSELMRHKPDPGVTTWLANQASADVFISVNHRGGVEVRRRYPAGGAAPV